MTEGNRDVTLFDRAHMPYTEAVVLEVLRTASSPIVPHVATQDTSIGGKTSQIDHSLEIAFKMSVAIVTLSLVNSIVS